MRIRPGYPVRVAPHCHVRTDWPARLRVGTGLACGEGVGQPVGPWRPPTKDEVEALTGAEAGGAGLDLVALPEHLMDRWWQAAEESTEERTGGIPWFDAFTREVGDFLEFKQLGVPDQVRYDLLVVAPGRAAVSWGAAAGGTGPASGGSPGAAPSPGALASRTPWAALNLGEQAAHLWFVNLPADAMSGMLRPGSPTGPVSSSEEDVFRRFVTACPGYPPVLLSLDRGEGVCFPEGILAAGLLGLGQDDPDLWLLIRAAGVG